MTTAKVFKTGRSQAVRIPKEYRFDVDEVMVNKVGDALILRPRGKKWGLLESAFGSVSPDFMRRRNQPRRADRRQLL